MFRLAPPHQLVWGEGSTREEYHLKMGKTQGDFFEFFKKIVKLPWSSLTASQAKIFEKMLIFKLKMLRK
jgi:hypothetical protein